MVDLRRENRLIGSWQPIAFDFFNTHPLLFGTFQRSDQFFQGTGRFCEPDAVRSTDGAAPLGCRQTSWTFLCEQIGLIRLIKFFLRPTCMASERKLPAILD